MHKGNSAFRYLFLTLVAVFMLSYLGCWIPSKETYYTDIDKEDVASIEIFDCSEEVDSYQSVGIGTLKDKEPMYSLEDAQIEPFLKDLSEIRFFDKGGLAIGAVDPSFYFGRRVVKISYQNGDCLYLSDRNYCVMDAIDDKDFFSNHCAPDEEEWSSLINSYVPEQ